MSPDNQGASRGTREAGGQRPQEASFNSRADLAVHDIAAFNVLVQVAKDALPADVNAPAAA
jgi:hypothetical protein